MDRGWFIIVALLITLSSLICWVLLTTIVLRRQSQKKRRRSESLGDLVRESVIAGKFLGTDRLGGEDLLAYLMEWHDHSQTMEIPEPIHREIREFIGSGWIMERIVSRLNSRSLGRRVEGLNLCELLDGETQVSLLSEALAREKKLFLRFKIVYLLCLTGLPGAVDPIVRSMGESVELYRRKVLSMLRDFLSLLDEWASPDWSRLSPEGRRVLILASRTGMKEWYHPFLTAMSQSEDETLSGEAAEVLLDVYSSGDIYRQMMDSQYHSRGVRQSTVYRLFKSKDLPDRGESARFLQSEELYPSVVQALSEVIREKPRLIPEIFERYRDAGTEREKTGYARVLATRIRYFIMRLKTDDSAEIRDLLHDVITLKLSSPIINFLNLNKNMAVENLLLDTIRPHLGNNEYFLRQCQLYLDRTLQEKLGLPEAPAYLNRKKIQLTTGDRRYMSLIALATVSVPFIIFFALHGAHLPVMSGQEKLVTFLFMYHRLFAFYTISINLVYLFFMFQSWRGITEKQQSWESAGKKFLYANGLLPSVSILAPAYNESQTIVQSVYSLLSLDYPDSELIIINDGSGDNTLQNLIEQFQLRVIDYTVTGELVTSPVRGVYRNDSIPNLLVIDKENGGKADALNTGLNVARGDFICCIDSDSLLEPEALTRMMFQTLTREERTVAIGGNIMPVNGCVTEKGFIREVRLSRNKFVRYQFIEYLRSFITGRVGQAKLNLLMIISGAFGAFRRDDVLSVGGYMTGTGNQRKDTVGEDMELVVRLTRHMKEQKIKYAIDYAPNANCWTEVPENRTDLMKQRDRWHRGLIEIMIYHKDMLFNRHYGTAGMVMFPYFYLFELLGPFLEVMGYLVLLLTLFLGLMSLKVFVFMFSIVILLGILVSSTAMYLSEKGILSLKSSDFREIIYRVIGENFGYRQYLSMRRTVSYVSYLFKNKGWQKFGRRGFDQGAEEINLRTLRKKRIMAALAAAAAAMIISGGLILLPGGTRQEPVTVTFTDPDYPDTFRMNVLKWTFTHHNGSRLDRRNRPEEKSDILVLSGVFPSARSDGEALLAMDGIKDRAMDSNLFLCDGYSLTEESHVLFRKRLEEFLQVEGTGWTIGYFRGADSATLWLYHESGEQLYLKGGEHFSGMPPRALFQGQEVPLYNMIPLYRAVGSTETTAGIDLNLTEKGKNLLREKGISPDIPLILENSRRPVSSAFFAVNIFDQSLRNVQLGRIQELTRNGKYRMYRSGSSDELYWKIYYPWVESHIESVLPLSHGAAQEGRDRFSIVDKRFVRTTPGGEIFPFFIKGVNLGAALPGKWFTEPPEDDALYYEWFSRMGEMHLNTLRIYTLLPPTFYRALRQYNLDHGDDPLYLIQELWPEEYPPDKDYLKGEYDRTYREEIAMDIDAIHGARSIPERRGRAWGVYRSDVSPWVIAYLVGRELEPEEVSETNRLNPGYAYEGRYVSAPRGPATEAWLAAMVDHAAAYETDRYGESRPMGIVSWPLLDTLHHRVEWNNPQLDGRPPFSDDAEMDINRLVVEDSSFGGLFGAYHIYPNYPDFMNNQASYAGYRDDEGVFRYGGYLKEFMETQVKYPAIVAEYGLSTSAAEAHHNPDGYHHGGLSEEKQAEGIIRMTEAIRREGYGGALIFEWMDEWAKKTWTTEPYMIPYHRQALWHNALDPEQNYGILAQRADSVMGRITYWSDNSPYSLYVWGSESHLYLHLSGLPEDFRGTVTFGLDTFSRERGVFFLPGPELIKLPSGIESLAEVNLGTGTARVRGASDYNIGNGKFASSFRQGQTFDPIRILINGAWVSEGGRYSEPYYTDWGELHSGPLDEIRNSFYRDRGGFTLRIPWGLLNVSDPSSGTVLHDPRRFRIIPERDGLDTFRSTGIRIYGYIKDEDRQSYSLLPDSFDKQTILYRWTDWDVPASVEEPKKSVEALAGYFAGVE